MRIAVILAFFIVLVMATSVEALAKLEVCKSTTGSGFGTFSFELHSTDNTWTSSETIDVGDCQVFSDLENKEYVIEEVGIPDGWSFDSIVCEPSDYVNIEGKKVTVDLSSTNYVKCTFNNIINYDTDGDGLSDGDEIFTYNTDPDNPDSDGDGFSDGEEVKSGTDPLNPDSYIPEFPSIALPIAALFGVFLILYRRK
jgi:hypothetical protein